MKMNRKELGNLGEDLAAEYLTRRGYRIRERQYRTRTAEIDLIAEKGGVIVFVEVKARRGLGFGRPAEAVTARKRQKIIAAARWYLSEKKLFDRLCRFDIIELLPDSGGGWAINQIENAFEA